MYDAFTAARQALISRSFLFAAAFAMLTVVIGASENIALLFARDSDIADGFHNTVLLSAIKSKTMLFALPIICALPFTASALEDIRSGYIKFILVRIAKRRYIFSKIFATWLSGGLALSVGILISQFVFFLLFSPAEAANLEAGAPSMFWEITGCSFVCFLTGGLFSVFGALAAVFTMNKYMAYASPFIFYYLLVILSERYLKNVDVLNPQEWLAAARLLSDEKFAAELFIVELTAVLVLLFCVCLGRRLKNV